MRQRLQDVRSCFGLFVVHECEYMHIYEYNQ
jgi:hypothetical protein